MNLAHTVILESIEINGQTETRNLPEPQSIDELYRHFATDKGRPIVYLRTDGVAFISYLGG